jgi:hypothetical protein
MKKKRFSDRADRSGLEAGGLIGDIQDEFPGYGYRRVTREL